MKPGLAVLPLEVWADVFVYPWITRKKLAKIVNKFKNRKFVEKLQFRLHNMGKYTLRYLKIIYEQSDLIKENTNKYYHLRKRKIPQLRALLAVAPSGYRSFEFDVLQRPTYEDFELPESEMPENIKKFKELEIDYLDDQVLDFLRKIKPLFTNVFLRVFRAQSVKSMRTLFGHLLPMVASFSGIYCDNKCVELLEKEFPGTLALTQELQTIDLLKASIPIYLNWLTAPQDIDQHEPRFLMLDAKASITKRITKEVECKPTNVRDNNNKDGPSTSEKENEEEK